jgi:hypothetical protein
MPFPAIVGTLRREAGNPSPTSSSFSPLPPPPPPQKLELEVTVERESQEKEEDPKDRHHYRGTKRELTLEVGVGILHNVIVVHDRTLVPGSPIPQGSGFLRCMMTTV